MTQLDAQTLSAVSTAGELLIRALATLDTLTPRQLEELRGFSGGALPDLLAMALDSASLVSPTLQASLETHPPASFIDRKL